MLLMTFGFFAILAATFGAVMALTRQSAEEKTIAHRMTLIHIDAQKQEGAAPGTAQLFKTARKSKLGWLDKLLERSRFAQEMEMRILQADSSTTVANLILTCVSLFIAGYLLAWVFTSMILVSVAAGVALCLLPYMLLSLKRSRRLRAFNAVLAEAIDMLARALRAGHSVVSAMEMLAENAQQPLASEFSEIFRQLNLGLPLRDALLQLLERVPSSDLRVLVTAILVQKETGGNLAEILDRTVFVIRERLRIQGEIQVQTAQGRLTGWILSALPVVMMVLLNLVNPGYSAILFQDPLGRKLLYGCAGLLLVGAWIIRRVVNGIEV